MILASCGAVRDALPDALAGSLGAEDAQTVAAHLAGCPECRAEAELIRLLRQQPIRVPEGLEARVRGAVPARSSARFRPVRPVLVAAAAAGLLLGGGLLVRSRRDGAPRASVVAPAPDALAPPAAAPAAAAPVDGRSLMQALPGTNDAGLFSSAATLDDLSEEELTLLLKELQS